LVLPAVSAIAGRRDLRDDNVEIDMARTVAYAVEVQFEFDLLNAKSKAFNDELCQSWVEALQHT